MRIFGQHRRRFAGGGVAFLAVLIMTVAAGPSAEAAGPPIVVEAWSSQVSSSSARMQALINPDGASTSYRVDYIAKVDYEANLSAGRGGFSGALRVPAITDFNLGSGSSPLSTGQTAFSLSPETTYLYRFVAHNSQGTSESPEPLSFTTLPTGGGAQLPDSRGWEQVSPVAKNGGAISAPENLPAGGVFQAAADGQSIAYSSATSFGSGAQGAPPASQYLGRREASGWSTTNLSTPLFSGTYDFTGAGDPFQVFDEALARSLILNGEHCRGGDGNCAVANPPLPGTDAPAGYQDYYLRDAGGGLEAVLGDPAAGFLRLDPADFDFAFAGAAPDLRHLVFSTCAALTANATETPQGEGCDPSAANLYEFSPGGQLQLVNVEPAQTQGTPGASLGAQSGAISADGSLVYWSLAGDLYLRRNGSSTVLVEAGAQFQTAAADGSVAFFTKGGHLYRYQASGGTASDLTPGGEVLGVLGASADGSVVYYETASGLFRDQNGASKPVAAAAAPSDYPPATGTARVSADGTRLLFLSTGRLTGYDNTDQITGEADEQVFLYDAAGAGSLRCVSCNPTNERPIGASRIPGAVPNGSVDFYKPRVLVGGGRRIVFESSDTLALTDTNGKDDVYEWEEAGVGSCSRPGGCLALLSSGRSTGGAQLIDSSASGDDVFFVTDDSLVASDPGAFDLYDARVGGGFPIPLEPLPCEGDACQPLPPPPVDPTLTTGLSGPGNPGVRFTNSRHCKKGFHKKKGKCVAKKHAKKKKKHAKKRKGGRR